MFEVNTATGIIEIIAVSLLMMACAYHLFLKQFMKEHNRTRRVADKVNAQVEEEVTVKNFGKMGGLFASDYVKNYLENLENDLKGAIAELDQLRRTGQMTPEIEQKIKALEGKIKQVNWLLQHREMLMTLNNQFVPAVVQRVAGRLIGGILG